MQWHAVDKTPTVRFFCFQADLVLLAMGFLGPEKYLIDELSLEQDPRCNIRTPAGRYSTSVHRVYAAGGGCSLCFFFVSVPGSVSLIGMSSVPSRLYVKSVLKAATNDVAKAGNSCR